MLAVSFFAWASDSASLEKTRRYQEDRQACMRGETNQVLDACLKEAKANFNERPGSSMEFSVDQLRRNASLRCDALNGVDRDDCLARMRGEGVIRGSVSSGGIYRELVTQGDRAP
ncbi:MAG: hypothetical protein CFE44_19605 [Burkholderiales bacterium PBB4]|nr:MAG: hypothetical protein CFE44_19605 [Burkholderiales bacterium PBB4]